MRVRDFSSFGDVPSTHEAEGNGDENDRALEGV